MFTAAFLFSLVQTCSLTAAESFDLDAMMQQLEAVRGKNDRAVVRISAQLLHQFPDMDADSRMWVMDLGSEALLNLGDWARARELSEDWMALADHIGNLRQQARARVRLGIALWRDGQIKQALTHFQEASRLAEAGRWADAKGVRINALNNQAIIYRDMGMPERALELFGQVRELDEPARNPEGAAATLNSIGLLFRDTGNPKQARKYMQLAYELSRKSGYTRGMADAENNLGVIALEQGDLTAAESAFRSSLELERQLHNRKGEVASLANLGEVAAKQGNLERALEFYRRARALAMKIGDAEGEMASRGEEANVLLRMGRRKQAAQLCLSILDTGDVIQDWDIRLRLWSICTDVLEQSGDLQEALRAWRKRYALSKRQAEAMGRQRLAVIESRFRVQEAEREARQAQSASRKQRHWILALAGVLVLVLVLLSTLVRLNRKLHLLNRKLDSLSRTDPLTGLMNRRAMGERMESEFNRYLRKPRPMSLLLLDVDHFKSVNDRFGHDCGDQALITVADVLEQSVRGQDAVARWGGEEFLILLPDTPLDGARIVAEKIRRNVQQLELTWGGDPVPLTVTIGVAPCTPEGIDRALVMVDTALYDGKRSGRNRVMVVNSDGSTMA